MLVHHIVIVSFNEDHQNNALLINLNRWKWLVEPVRVGSVMSNVNDSYTLILLYH